jgi:DNA-directed RNA polymerase specialized sigma24 family protein/CheY-like chemotaxis protein
MTQFYELVKGSIPRMRRYASILTGSRGVADDYAQAWLERLIRQELVTDARNSAVNFFRTFHDVVSPAEIDLDTGRKLGASRLERDLLALPVEQRVALLLVHVEGFTREQAAFIVGCDPESLARTLARARARLWHNFSTSVFIIEDEAVAALDISRLVEDFGHSVCGAASDRDEARAGIEAAQPAIVLADVRLGGSPTGGIEACEDVCNHYALPVVYVTGFPERVRRLVRRTDVLVVVKPFEPEILRTAMALAIGALTAPID